MGPFQGMVKDELFEVITLRKPNTVMRKTQHGLAK